MFEKSTTKLQFKFDMGLNDAGKTIVMSKTYDNLKNLEYAILNEEHNEKHKFETG